MIECGTVKVTAQDRLPVRPTRPTGGCTRNKDRMKAGAQPSNKGEIWVQNKRGW